MRKTGSNISHNNNSNEIRGGEKKVMKKSLSVILSTTMALSAFTSVALAATSSTDFSDLKDLSAADKVIFDQLIKDGIFLGTGDGKFGINEPMKRSQFAVAISKALKYTADATTSSFADVNADAPELPYIEAAYKNGVANGNPTTPPTFSPADNVSREQLAIFLVGAMGPQYKAEAEKATGNDATVTSWAQGYVATAVKYKLMDGAATGFDGKTPATRYMLAKGVDATLKAIAEANKPAVATKVESVSATNLKEVVVKFDGPVDKETATDKINYSLKSGKQIDVVTLSEDGTTATLRVVNTLANNKTEAVNVSNVKAGDTTLNVKNVEFTVSDNEIPEVVEVKSLGTKSLKVVFSEPVNNPAQANFMIDGKAFFGKVKAVGSEREVILTPFSSSTLTVGDHNVTVTGVKDYANFSSLRSSHDFTVVEDKEAPTVESAEGTLEKITITYSKEVDEDSIDAAKVYWKSGNDKKKASSFKVIAGNQYEYYFAGDNALPTGSVVLYVEGVKDYSGNAIAKDTTVVVTPTIDQTRPEVKKVEGVTTKQVKVTFSKGLKDDENLKNVKNYTITNGDDKVLSVKSAKLDDTVKANNVIIIDLYQELTVGANSIVIKNVRDNTKLQNTMLDFSGEFKVADEKSPKLAGHLVNTKDRIVTIQFNKKMDIETLGNYSNYTVTMNDKRVPLTSEMADINVLQDGKVVVITFAETYKDKDVVFGTGSLTTKYVVSDISVLSVKDAAGNLLAEFLDPASKANILDVSKNINVDLKDYDSDYAGFAAALVDQQTIKVKFNASITDVKKGAFTVLDGNTDVTGSVDVDGSNVVTINLTKKIGTNPKNLKVTVDTGLLLTVSGQLQGKELTPKILGLVAPVVKGTADYEVKGQDIIVPFSDDLFFDVKYENIIKKNEMKVVRDIDGHKLTVDEFSIALDTADNSKLVITLKDASDRKEGSYYSVEFLGSQYLTDTLDAENGVAATAARDTATKVGFVSEKSIKITGATTIQVPTTGKVVTETYKAVVKDQSGNQDNVVALDLTGKPASADPTGVTFDKTTGVLTVNTNATPGEYVLTGTSVGITSATLKINVTKEGVKVSSIDVTGPASIELPLTGDVTPAPKYVAVVKDQFGKEITSGNDAIVVWTVNKGTINPTTGELTVSSTTPEGTYTVTATSFGTKEVVGTKEVTVKKAASVASTITVTGDTAVTMPNPAADQKMNFKAVVKDQYGVEIKNNAVYSLKAAVAGVDINPLTGEVTIKTTVADGAKFTVVATSSTVSSVTAESAVVTVTVVAP
ncbi:S-layer homology domain-containing protein [Paenibacillus albiflavus]|uniref:S-layer homology domain-containing protein n=1 Tax=Paenibacillus albiflavus TaxID=2545760 RepID=A0A4R4EAD8_9BACL|nr:S-layer homology domain-containing protein [Paenibacillus albiflavus]TCZ76824.1 S-layer homology domain-containing protein [Paenibacillus albiflavus]